MVATLFDVEENGDRKKEVLVFFHQLMDSREFH